MQFYVLKKLRIPERLEIAAQGLFVVGIVFAAENARFEGVVTHSAVTEKFDALDDGCWLAVGGRLRALRSILRLGRCNGFGFRGNQNQKTEKVIPSPRMQTVPREIFLRCSWRAGRERQKEYREPSDPKRQNSKRRTDSPISGH